MKIGNHSYKYLVIMFFIVGAMYGQGPWAKGKGEGYAQLLFNIVPTYDELFDEDSPEGTIETERELSDITIQSYIEYGLSDKLTVGGTIPFVFVSAGDQVNENVTPRFAEDNLGSLGNISFWGKYTLIDKKVKLAVISEFSLPTSTLNEASGLATGVDAFSFQPKLSIGSSNSKFYYFGFFGYGLRNNDFNDFLNFGVEGGFNSSENLSFILNISRLHNLGNGSSLVDSPAQISTGFYTSFQEYTSFSLKVFADKIYKDFGAFASLGGGGIRARSVAVSPALGIGVFYKW